MPELYGYMGKILRVDLTKGSIAEESLSPAFIEKFVGGTGFGAEYLYREVPPGVEWNDPENRIIMASGPLGGTLVSGTGTFSLVTKGPMTNLAVSTQANGMWAAFLKFAGYDGLVIQGQAPKWVYLHIEEGRAELRDASAILGQDTWEMEEAIRKDLGTAQGISVFGVGPAGEHLVRYAGVVGDRGHIASKNGCGCVMGAKRLKAIAISRGRKPVMVRDKETLVEKNKALDQDAKANRGGLLYKWGTGGTFSPAALGGWLPVRNYTTSLFPEHEKMNGEYLRTHFQENRSPAGPAGSYTPNT